MTTRPASAVALVESPAQLLNAVEWAWADALRRTDGQADAAGDFGAGVAIRVLAPMDPSGRVQLHRMIALAHDHGFDVGWHEVRGRRSTRLSDVARLGYEMSRAETVLVGDPFSGMIQFLVGLVAPYRTVVVDDGSATLEFVEIIHDDRELVRWHSGRQTGRPTRLLAALAKRRMLSPRPSTGRNTLRLFTSMPVESTDFGVEVNDLSWIRHRFAAPRVVSGAADVVGTSLVESDIVSEEHYLGAVESLVGSHNANRYLAHRRESAAKLAKIGDLGLEIVRSELPVEIRARQGPTPARIISFPSTVVHTLPLALSDTEIEVLLCDIEPDWFNPIHVGSRTVDFLRSVAEGARRTHRLRVVEPTGRSPR